jgi:single-strand DNA-binding protein
MNEKIQISGTVETVLPVETFPSGFSKRVLVINTGGKYPQTVPVEFVKDNVDLLTGLRKGQSVTAHINLRGNEHKGRYYLSCNGWRLEVDQASPPPQATKDQQPASAAPVEEDDDQIPF